MEEVKKKIGRRGRQRGKPKVSNGVCMVSHRPIPGARACTLGGAEGGGGYQGKVSVVGWRVMEGERRRGGSGKRGGKKWKTHEGSGGELNENSAPSRWGS